MRTFGCVIVALALGVSARADCMSQTVGPTTIHNGDGKSSTSHTGGLDHRRQQSLASIATTAAAYGFE